MNFLVVGDVILDEYVHSKKLGVSAETPTLVGEYERTDRFVGGAGLVARNLLRLHPCNYVWLLTMGMMENPAGKFISLPDPLTDSEFNRLRMMNAGFWKLTEKKRIYIDDYKVAQIDVRNHQKHDDQSFSSLITIFRQFEALCDVVIVCDNGHGTIDSNVLQKLIECTDKRVYVDCQLSQERDYRKMLLAAENCTALFLNEKEFERALHDLMKSNIMGLSNQLGCDIIVKTGSKGATKFKWGEQKEVSVGAPNVKVVDTCGAGDAFLAAYASQCMNLEYAVRWASLSTTYRGTVVPDPKLLETENE